MLSPLDIQSVAFSKSISGYHKSEVDEFMALILKDYEALYRENIALKDRNNVLSEGLEHYKAMEETMQNTLIVAQQTGEELKKNAEDKAKLILEDANLRAKERADAAQNKVAALNSEFEALKKEMELYKTKTIAALSAQIKALESDQASDN